jgi:hypothetical protein
MPVTVFCLILLSKYLVLRTLSAVYLPFYLYSNITVEFVPRYGVVYSCIKCCRYLNICNRNIFL